MIKSFRNKLTENIWHRYKVKKGFPPDLFKITRRKLGIINDQWRICFIWRDENAYNVEITDYH